MMFRKLWFRWMAIKQITITQRYEVAGPIIFMSHRGIMGVLQDYDCDKVFRYESMLSFGEDEWDEGWPLFFGKRLKVLAHDYPIQSLISKADYRWMIKK